MMTNVWIEVNEAIKASDKTTALRCNSEETILFQMIDEYDLKPDYSILIFRILFICFIPFIYAVRRHWELLGQLFDAPPHLINALTHYIDGVFIADKDGRLLFANTELERRHGFLQPGQNQKDYFNTKDSEWFTKIFDHLTAQEPVRIIETEIHDQYNQKYHARILNYALGRNASQVSLTFVRDISREKLLQEQIQTRQNLTEWKMQSLENELVNVRRQMTDLQQGYGRLMIMILDLSKRLAGPYELGELMQYLVEETQRLFNAETAALFLLEGNRLVRKAVVGFDVALLPEEIYQVGQGITGKTILPKGNKAHASPTRQNFLHNDSNAVASYVEQYQNGLGTKQLRHMLAVPLSGQQRSFGVLRLMNKLEGKTQLSLDGFSIQDEEYLVALAAVMAVAIENVRLTGQIETVNEVALRMSQALDENEIYPLVVESVHNIVPRSEKVGIYMISHGELLVNKAFVDSANLASYSSPMHSNEGIAGRAIRERELIYVPDTTKDSDFIPRNTPLQSLMVAPLVSGNHVVGMLSMDSDKPNAFTEGDQHLLKMFASQVVAAKTRVEFNHRRFDEQTRRAARESLKRDLHEVSNTLHSTLMLRTARLQSLVARNQYDRDLFAFELNQLASSAQYIYDGISQIRGDLNDPHFAEHGILEALQHHAELLQLDIEFDGQDICFRDDTIKHALLRIGREALTNVHKHARQGIASENWKPVRITLKQDQHSTLFVVQDRGTGFDVENVQKNHDALGLTAIYWYAKSIQADCRILSEMGLGTQILVSFPSED